MVDKSRMGKTELHRDTGSSTRKLRLGALLLVVSLLALLPDATAGQADEVFQTDGPVATAQFLPSTAPTDSIVTVQLRVDNSANDTASRFTVNAQAHPWSRGSDNCGFDKQGLGTFKDATLDAGEVCVLEYPFLDQGAEGEKTFFFALQNLGDEIWFTATDGSAVTPQPPIFANATVTWVYYPPPSLSLSFGSPAIQEFETTTLTYHFDNSNPAQPASSLSMQSIMPEGLALLPGTIQSTCGGTTVVTVAGESLRLVGGEIAPNGTCAITVPVGASQRGIYDNLADFDFLEATVGGELAIELLADVSAQSLTVTAPTEPIVPLQHQISAGPAVEGPSGGDLRTARYELTNPNPIDALAIDVNISASQQPNDLITDCIGTSLVSPSTVTLENVELAAGQTCTVEFTVSKGGLVSGRLLASATSRLLPIEPPVQWDYSLGERCFDQRIDFDVQRGVPFVGTDLADVVRGSFGPDVIDVRGGDDRVCAGSGDDVVYGRDGSDLILGEDGRDKLYGGAGVDGLGGGPQIDRLWGQQGDDVLFGNGGSDRIYGGSGNDLVRAGSGADRVFGGPGNDEIYGMGGQDFLRGEDGDDQLQGNFQSDRLWGGKGNDVLRGAEGKDRLYGGPGDDELYGGANTDFLQGDSGTDLAHGQRGRDNPLVIDRSGCIAEIEVSC